MVRGGAFPARRGARLSAGVGTAFVIDIRPIATQEDYEDMLAEIKRVWSAEPRLERAREPFPEEDPVEATRLRAGRKRRSTVIPDPCTREVLRARRTANGVR